MVSGMTRTQIWEAIVRLAEVSHSYTSDSQRSIAAATFRNLNDGAPDFPPNGESLLSTLKPSGTLVKERA